MTVAISAQAALDYFPCRYGRSRVLFRGPRQRLDAPYVGFLGGTETYGRFIETPFPALLEQQLGQSCVNFGAVNAGLDLYLHDPAVLGLAERADACVLQIMGAQNMSNRYYSVHPRRNDRFLRASDRLQQLYPEVDFTEFHFNRHMLGRLQSLSAQRFDEVVMELRLAWVARMKHLLTLLRGRVLLLWFADQSPPDTPIGDTRGDPLFVDRSMVEALRPRVAGLVETPLSVSARKRGAPGMIFSDYEANAAAELMGPQAHEETAEQLLPLLRELLC
ncbi:hypothetical protein AL036_00840 [Salipiger aestuarii]|uniref:DUF6473 domain-containing protein n=1 Tax=Salipiger aestuarii TaxID=568098 RepID=A0A327YNB9_9RHOB|nr:DUF6473 family protein [Salipiger aestuarii]EIE48773.1 hypothetical protein C357_21475 [Citreicella sp. 357]KAA8610459.1 hypothetical protein AL036_00840 [Salipiger aestuarii]KAA8616475.1 hypothetical protein AL037_00835 [Salipiger aestuarii]KAB2543430.1 hypothetical protein AL035_01150 [Salipiger aestuarii]RAK22012.1 hypothetical protein ATI53_1003168 [Salipiger aestuarii]